MDRDPSGDPLAPLVSSRGSWRSDRAAVRLQVRGCARDRDRRRGRRFQQALGLGSPVPRRRRGDQGLPGGLDAPCGARGAHQSNPHRTHGHLAVVPQSRAAREDGRRRRRDERRPSGFRRRRRMEGDRVPGVWLRLPGRTHPRHAAGGDARDLHPDVERGASHVSRQALPDRERALLAEAGAATAADLDRRIEASRDAHRREVRPRVQPQRQRVGTGRTPRPAPRSRRGVRLGQARPQDASP